MVLSYTIVRIVIAELRCGQRHKCQGRTMLEAPDNCVIPTTNLNPENDSILAAL